MAQASFPRLRPLAQGGAGLIRDLFFARLCVAAAGLWRPVRFLSLVLIALLIACLWLSGFSAITVYRVLRPATEWPVGPAIAAFLVFCVLLELGCAGLTMIARAVLQLSLDIGRHRMGTLLIMLSLATAGLSLLDLIGAPPVTAGVSAAMATMLVLMSASLWFARVYRRPAHPRFRDFHGDVVRARAHLDRAADGR